MPEWSEDEDISPLVGSQERANPLGVRRAVLGGVAGAALLVGPVGLAKAVVPEKGANVETGDGDPGTLLAAMDASAEEAQAVSQAQLSSAIASQEAPVAGSKPAAVTTTAPTTTTTSTTTTTTVVDEVDPPPDSGGGFGDPNAYATWDALAECETGGDWSTNTGNGYYGGIQFSLATWQAVGGTGYPHEHSRETQIHYGQVLQAQSGWGQWPACAAELGLI